MMDKNGRSRKAWVGAGTVVSLGALGLAIARGNRAGGRIAAGFAGAFLEAWGDMRLEKKVAGILAKARAEGTDARSELETLWNGPEIEMDGGIPRRVE